jgi:hypothetical protein
MSFLNRLLGKKSTPPDPTLEWPSYQDFERIVIPHEGKFGVLKFGDPIDAAKSFGKPARVRWIDNSYCALHYPQAGFQLDFEHGSLVYFALFANRSVDDSESNDDINPAIIHLQKADGKTAQLSKDSKRSDIETIFGKPSTIDFDDDETVLYYKLKNLTLEFELLANDGVLMRMNLFPAND